MDATNAAGQDAGRVRGTPVRTRAPLPARRSIVGVLALALLGLIGAGLADRPALGDHRPTPCAGAAEAGDANRAAAVPAAMTGASVQAAVDALPEEGGFVRLSAGTYSVPVAVRLRSGVTICGEGAATVIYVPENVTAFKSVGSSSTHASNVWVREVRIVGDRSGAAPALYFESCDDCGVLDVTVEGVGRDRRENASAVWMKGGTRGRVAGSTLTRSGYSGVVIDSQTDTEVSGNHVSGSGHAGILVVGRSDGVVVAENDVRDNGLNADGTGREGRSGILVMDDGTDAARTVVIRDNVVVNNGDHGIQVFWWVRNGILSEAPWEAISITGNTVTGHKNWPRGGAGIELEQARFAVVSGNVLSNNNQGINTYNSSELAVTANAIRDSRQNGIAVYGTKRSIFSANTIERSGLSDGGHGIDIQPLVGASRQNSPRSTGNSFLGNRISESRGADVQFQPNQSGNTAIDNLIEQPIVDHSGDGNVIHNNRMFARTH